jgi:hypothetical protein
MKLKLQSTCFVKFFYIVLTSPTTFVCYLAKANGALAFFEAHLLALAQQDYYNISLH